MFNKKKIVALAVAITIAELLILGETFCWQSVSQQSLSEIKITVDLGAGTQNNFE